MYESEICRRTIFSPVPIFKPADYGIRIGLSENKSVSGTDTSSLYRLDFPKSDGLNFTSQMTKYHALNVTLLPCSLKEIIFTMNTGNLSTYSSNTDDIGSRLTVHGCANENLYVINVGSKKSIIVHPLETVDGDYLRVRSIYIFLPRVSSLDNVSFGVDIR